MVVEVFEMVEDISIEEYNDEGSSFTFFEQLNQMMPHNILLSMLEGGDVYQRVKGVPRGPISPVGRHGISYYVNIIGPHTKMTNIPAVYKDIAEHGSMGAMSISPNLYMPPTTITAKCDIRIEMKYLVYGNGKATWITGLFGNRYNDIKSGISFGMAPVGSRIKGGMGGGWPSYQVVVLRTLYIVKPTSGAVSRTKNIL